METTIKKKISRGIAAHPSGNTPAKEGSTQSAPRVVYTPSSSQQANTPPAETFSVKAEYSDANAYYAARDAEAAKAAAKDSEQAPAPKYNAAPEYCSAQVGEGGSDITVPPEIDGEQTASKKYKWELCPKLLDPTAELDPTPTFATMAGRPAFPLTGIVAFNGKAKQGKSTAINALLLALLKGTPFGTLVPTEHRPKSVLLLDTEMSRASLIRRTRAIHKALGRLDNRYQVAPLLDVETSGELWKEAMALVEFCDPDIVVFDKITDFVDDFNDQKECKKLYRKLLTLAKTRAVWVTIHQNKAADNTLSKGHLGSLITEGATENYSAKKKGHVYSATPVSSRDTEIIEGETEGLQFLLNSDGEFISATDILAQNKALEREGWIKNMQCLFGNDTELRHSEFMQRIQEKEGLSKTAAANKIDEAAKCGAIVKVDPTNRRSPYRITDLPATPSMSVPF